MTSPRITSKRRRVQAVLIASALLLPFLSIGGNPFLRMDISMRTLFMAGVPVRVDQFYLVLLATLFVVVFFLLLTVILGRVWCGWLCPQTVFNDLAELIGERFRKRVSPPVSRLIEHASALSVSAVISFNMLCWFMSPASVAAALVDFSSNPLLMASFLTVSLFGYLNLLLVKRSFCHSYCPYGRFQAALTDEGTLNLAFLEESRERCLRCNACVRCCPMEIDIREGFQIECINCGRCIDACRGVMERRLDGPGLIDYRFGTRKGTRFKPGSKTVLLGVVTLVLGVGLAWGLAGRNQTAFALQRIATAEPQTMPDGFQAQPWRAIIGNRSESPVTYSLRTEAPQVGVISLLGPVSNIMVAPNESREITFLIRHKHIGGTPRTVVLQLFEGDRLAASVKVRL
ncbi:MAG: 4Fe-4S binding protein [Geobacteraceae bacterium]|nr:4Fe-4S binding protein [Geobacteraceae bacterium]